MGSVELHGRGKAIHGSKILFTNRTEQIQQLYDDHKDGSPRIQLNGIGVFAAAAAAALLMQPRAITVQQQQQEKLQQQLTVYCHGNANNNRYRYNDDDCGDAMESRV